MVKIKHITALCLVLVLVLPSTALAANNIHQPKVTIHATPIKEPLKVKISYTLTGAKEKKHTWYLGDGFSCHCKHRTYNYKHHGTYKIKFVLTTTTGKTLVATKNVRV